MAEVIRKNLRKNKILLENNDVISKLPDKGDRIRKKNQELLIQLQEIERNEKKFSDNCPSIDFLKHETYSQSSSTNSSHNFPIIDSQGTAEVEGQKEVDSICMSIKELQLNFSSNEGMSVSPRYKFQSARRFESYQPKPLTLPEIDPTTATNLYTNQHIKKFFCQLDDISKQPGGLKSHFSAAAQRRKRKFDEDVDMDLLRNIEIEKLGRFQQVMKNLSKKTYQREKREIKPI